MTFALIFGVMVCLPAAAPADADSTPLTVRPMPAPKPALRYQLLPEVRELSPGNSAQWYLRCFAEQRNFFFTKEGNAQRDRYRGMTLAELAREDLRKYGGNALNQADWGARLDTIDWDMQRKLQTEGTEIRLPELAAFRVLAISLQVRLRGAIALEDYDAAIRTAKTMFAFARHLGEHPTLEANRLGLDVANLTLDGIEEMIQQPHGVNLYWALTDLPAPLVELRKGFQGRRMMVDRDLEPLRKDAAMTEEQLEEFVSKLSGRIGFIREQAGRPPKNLRAAIDSLVADRERIAKIRSRLLKEAPGGGVLDKISALEILGYRPLQLILLDERSEFEASRDDALKLLSLAPWQIDALEKTQAKRREGIFSDFLPNVVPLRRTQARLEQRIAMLRCIEGLRMYAAEHEAELPQKWEAVALPAPIDPFTGKAVGYSNNNGSAKLIGDGKCYDIRIKP